MLSLWLGFGYFYPGKCIVERVYEQNVVGSYVILYTSRNLDKSWVEVRLVIFSLPRSCRGLKEHQTRLVFFVCVPPVFLVSMTCKTEVIMFCCVFWERLQINLLRIVKCVG